MSPIDNLIVVPHGKVSSGPFSVDKSLEALDVERTNLICCTLLGVVLAFVIGPKISAYSL